MTPEQLREFEELKATVAALQEARDPQLIEGIKRLSGIITVEQSGTAPSTIAQSVNEAGSSTFDVSSLPDGLYLINGKKVPYYN